MSLTPAGERLLQCTEHAVAHLRLCHRKRVDGSQAIAELSSHLLCAIRASAASLLPTASLLDISDRVLHCIMLHLPLVDRITLSSSCKVLRVRSLAMPELWSKVTTQTIFPVYQGTRLAALQGQAAQLAAAMTVLRRCHSHPTSLLCSMDISPQSPINLMAAAVGKVTFLGLNLFVLRVPSDPDLWDIATRGGIPALYELFRLFPQASEWMHFFRTIMCPATRLETLQLVAWGYATLNQVPAAAILPRHLLGGVPNMLNRLLLRGNLRLPRGGCPAFSCLTVFDWIPFPATISTLEIDDILSHMPLLEVFGLRVQRLVELQSDGTPATVHRRLRSVLLELAIIGPDDRVVLPVQVFQARTIPETRYISVDLTQGGLAPQPFSTWGDLPDPLCAPQTIRIVNGHLYAYGPQWRVLAPCTGREFPPLSEADMFQHLVTLTLPEVLWDSDAGDTPFPEAPCLLRLCIELFPCRGPWRDGDGETEGIFVAAAHFKRPWRTPLLENLEFAFSPAGLSCVRASTFSQCSVACLEGGVLALSDVALFVRSCLAIDRDRGRLKRISLTGVRGIADDEPGGAYLDLESLTEELQVTSQWSNELVDLARLWRWRVYETDSQASAPTLEPEFAAGTQPLPVFTADDALFRDVSYDW